MDSHSRKKNHFVQFKPVLYFLFFVFICNPAFAGPWLLPGKLSVKSDIDLLAEAGLIKAPVMTWPIAWVNIGPELLSPETKAKLPKEPEAVQQAYQRIVTLYQKSYQPYKTQTSVYASGSNQLNPFRTFEYELYSPFASGVSTAYQRQHFAESVNISYYNTQNQSYSNYFHVDNSYAYLLLGNWAIGVDQFNRWWGPGYSDSMILSENAEPFPVLGIQRMDAEAFHTKWLHWIGPWSLSSVVSKDGPSYYIYPAGVDNALFWFTNISFRPFQSLQFDVSRNVIFAGEQRPLNSTMFYYLVTMRDSWASSTGDNAPGSEEWDIGTKWSLMPVFNIPIELYQQTLFSDEGGNTWFNLPLPDCTTFLLGTDIATQLDSGTLKTYFEYEYNVERLYYFWGKQAYWTGVPNDSPKALGSSIVAGVYGGQYPYTYYNNVLGSSLGSEGIGYTLGVILAENDGDSDTASLRFLQLNSFNYGVAGTPGYPFSKQDVIWASIGRTVVLLHHIGTLTSEMGYIIPVGQTGDNPTGFSATVTWSKNF